MELQPGLNLMVLFSLLCSRLVGSKFCTRNETDREIHDIFVVLNVVFFFLLLFYLFFFLSLLFSFSFFLNFDIRGKMWKTSGIKNSWRLLATGDKEVANMLTVYIYMYERWEKEKNVEKNEEEEEVHICLYTYSSWKQTLTIHASRVSTTFRWYCIWSFHVLLYSTGLFLRIVEKKIALCTR